MATLDCFKLPFKSAGKLAIAFLLSLVPVLNFAVIGWQLKNAKAIMQNDFEPQDWKGFGKILRDGFLAFVILLVFALPAAILFAAMFGSIASIVLKGAQFTIANYSFYAEGLLAFIILTLAFIFVGPAGVLNFVAKGSFKKAFSPIEIAKIIFTKKYLKNWGISLVYVILLFWLYTAASQYVLPILPKEYWTISSYVFWLFFSFIFLIAGTTIWAMLGEAYTSSVAVSPVREQANY